MNILYAVHHFPPKFTGGAELRTQRTASFMQQRNHSVSVVCVEQVTFGPQSYVEAQEELFGDITVYRLKVQFDNPPIILGYVYQNASILKFISELLEEKQVDLFHLFGGYLLTADALKAARAKNVPSVVSLTDFWYLCPSIQLIRPGGDVCPLPVMSEKCARCLSEDKRRYRWLGKIFPSLMDYYWRHQRKVVQGLKNRSDYLMDELNQVNLIISPSNFLREVYILHGIDPKRIIYSRQGVDLSALPEVFPDKKASEILRIGYIGQIAKIKGVHILIEAMNELKEQPVQLDIYGDLSKYPGYVESLKNLARTNPRIQFKGVFDRKELPKVIEKIDVLVVPSIWYENSPNTIQEAFATRTPVIASDLGGMAELVKHHENGLLFEAGNAISLADQIRLISGSPALKEKLTKGIESIKSTEVEMDELEKMYERVINGENLSVRNI